jgi:Acetyltransferase (GNAT) family
MDQIGIPLAGDDPEAVKLTARLVRDAGFDPVIVGKLARGKAFEPDTRPYNSGMTGPQLRNATIDDAPAIGSMVDEFRSYLQALGDVHACVNFGSEQYRRDGFGPNPAFQGLIAERGGQALAYAFYAFDYSTDTGSRTVFLHDLFVRSACRGQGIGEALLQRLMEICKAAGATSMNWLVWHRRFAFTNVWARIRSTPCA